jgi:methyltransferase
MVSQALYSVLIAAIALQRLSEVALSRRNRAWALARGALEFGSRQLPAIKLLHTAFLCGCLIEVGSGARPFIPALGVPCLAIIVACQAVRYWTVATLGPRWNVSILVIPGLPLEQGGPYRFLRHPNYLVVVFEGLAIPLVHSAWLSALLFTLVNVPLLRARIHCEEAAFQKHAASPEAWHFGSGGLFGLLGTPRAAGVKTSR